MNRDFKGIWIPKEIWLQSKISIQAKSLWAEIDSLYCEESGGCYASDEYLSQFLGLGIRRIQEILKELRKNKLLVTTTKDNRNRIMKALPLKTASSKIFNFCKEVESSTLSRAFLGIWIPREIWLHPEISLQAKILWSEIKSLSCEQRKGCYASDQYLMNFLGLKTSQLHVFLKELKDHNLVISINPDRRKRLLQAIDIEHVETQHRKSITQDSGSQLRRIPEVNYAGFRKSITQDSGSPIYKDKNKEEYKEKNKEERERTSSPPPISSTSSAKTEQKDSHGELQHVKLSQKEYNKLLDKLGKNILNKMIKRLDLYIAQSGKRYKSHYATILKWLDEDQEKNQKADESLIAKHRQGSKLAFETERDTWKPPELKPRVLTPEEKARIKKEYGVG